MSKAKTPFHAIAFITWSCLTCCWETTTKKINFHSSEENITLLKFLTPWFVYPIDHGDVEIIFNYLIDGFNSQFKLKIQNASFKRYFRSLS